jgi:hypothetical protein
MQWAVNEWGIAKAKAQPQMFIKTKIGILGTGILWLISPSWRSILICRNCGEIFKIIE